MVRTPYDARQHAALGASWAQRGYHCLIQDVRGRYRSDGEWSPYQHEGHDGAALVMQLHRQYPTIPIVLFGASYAAHCAVEAARTLAHQGATPPAAVIALVPALGLAETAWTTHGQPQLKHRIGWWHEHGQGHHSLIPLTADELDRRIDLARRVGPTAAAQHWRWSDHTQKQWERLWQAQRVDLLRRYAQVSSPLLVVTGKHDFFDDDAHRLAAEWPTACHLVTGPWGHNLARDITDPHLRTQLQAVGGVGAVIDAWLQAQGLPGRAAPWTQVLCDDAAFTQSLFNSTDGTWHHERTMA